MLGNTVITEGVKYFADKAEAYWLVSDIIINCKMREGVKEQEFVSVKAGTPKTETLQGIRVEYFDGNRNILWTDYYPISTLPDNQTYTLWFTNDTLLLPSEY